MKKYLFLIAIFFTTLTCFSQPGSKGFEVTGLEKAEKVRINGSPVTLHQYIDRNTPVSSISWGNNDEARIRVKDKATSKEYKLSKRQIDSKKSAKTIEDICLGSQDNSTKRTGNNNSYLRTEMGSTRTTSDEDFVSAKWCNNRFDFGERRIALVIGNTNYTCLPSLLNPMNDAISVTDKLLTLGFDVVETFDCDNGEFRSVLSQFEKIADGYQIVLFYYAGHGIQKNGKNYLVPVTERLQQPSDIENCVDCEDVVHSLERTGCRSRIVIFDACRNINSALLDDEHKGFAQMHQLEPGTMVIFSTGFGQVADDGDGDHSHFTQALLDIIGKQEVFFEIEIKNVVNETYRQTSKRQRPEILGILTDTVILNPLEKYAVFFSDEDSYTRVSLSPTKKSDSSHSFPFDNPEDLYFIGKCYYELYKNQDLASADTLSFPWLRESAENGFAHAQMMLAEKYFTGGYGIQKNTINAHYWLNKAADNDNLEVTALVGDYYREGKYGLQKDVLKAKTLYEKSLKSHDAIDDYRKTDEAYFIGNLYENGCEGLEPNYEEALNWYEKAYEAAPNSSLFQMISALAIGDIYKKGGKGFPKNYLNALKWYENAFSISGSFLTAEYIADLYKEGGAGLSKDYSKALEWYQRLYISSTCGMKDKEYYANSVGNIYNEGGYGVKRNRKNARIWYKKGKIYQRESEKGQTPYQYYCVAEDYLEEKDTLSALKYYTLAAKRGYPDAQYELWWIYSEYNVNYYDEKKSKRWYSVAVNQSDNPFMLNRLGDFGGYGSKESFDCYQKAYKIAQEVSDLTYDASWAAKSIGRMYYNGAYVKENWVSAVKWFKRALELGYYDGGASLCGNIADLYAKGGAGIQKDYREAKKWYLAGIDSMIKKQYFPEIYRCVDGIVALGQDTIVAAEWAKQSKAGFSSDGLKVATFLEFIEENSRAIVVGQNAYYKDGPDALIADKIANLYQKGGSDFQPNLWEAVKWYKKAVEAGDPTAMIKIAKLYESGGYNLKKDPKEAARWYRMAEVFDLPEAKEGLKRLGY